LDAISGERAFQYDAAGNTVNNDLATFNYNDRNRMASSSANELTTTYRYNALGQRVEKSSGAGTIHFLYNLEGQLIAETNGATGAVTVEYAYLDGEPLAMWRDEETASPTPPDAPTLLSPLDTVASASPTFTWEHIEEGGVDQYRLRVYDRTVPGWVHDTTYFSDDICDAGICSQSIPESLGFASNHAWRVRAYNAAGWSVWTNEQFAYEENAQSLILNGGFESGDSSWLSCSDNGTTSTSVDAVEGSQARELAGGDCLYQEYPIAAGNTYTLSCQGKTTEFGSVSVTLMDSSFNTLSSDSVSVSSGSYSLASVTDTAPNNSAIGAITLYGEGVSLFDACSVTEGQ